jgi:hypothetical protein
MYTLAGGTCPANDIGPTQKVVHFVERWVTVRGRVCLLSLLRSKLARCWLRKCGRLHSTLYIHPAVLHRPMRPQQVADVTLLQYNDRPSLRKVDRGGPCDPGPHSTEGRKRARPSGDTPAAKRAASEMSHAMMRQPRHNQRCRTRWARDRTLPDDLRPGGLGGASTQQGSGAATAAPHQRQP